MPALLNLSPPHPPIPPSPAGKKAKKGLAGAAVQYIPRTRAIKQLQITIKDFRRLCILKGIYPRDPPSKRNLDRSQTYYHHKDIAYLHHEPVLKKFRETKTFMKKLASALGRRELGDARALYEARPTYTLDHIVKQRYPRFADALSDLDDALSLLHMFASLPAEFPIKAEHTAAARRLAREWQYYVARTHALRRVFFSIKGAYLQADVRGIPVTWLVPWAFSQVLPTDVDYRVMLTFLELHDTVVRFTLFKLYSDAGLAYPPNIRADAEDDGAHLTALDVRTKGEAAAAAAKAAAAAPASSAATAAAAAAAAAAASVGKAPAASAEAAARLATLKSKLKSIAGAAGATGEEAGASASSSSSSSAGSAAAASAAAAAASSVYDALLADDDDEAAAAAAAEGDAGMDGGDGSGAAEARAAAEKSKKDRQFQRLFSGLVFFLNREVPRELFELLVVALRGRVGWDGPGSPYAASDPRITHQVVDRPLPASGSGAASSSSAPARVEGREYVQPQWVADSINARMLLPVAKYAPGASLPPHLSPFVDDAAEGYVPAYREELDRLRSAAAVTGRLADVLDGAAAAAARAASNHKAGAGGMVEDGEEEEEDGEEEEDDDDEEELDGGEDDDDDDEDGGEEDEEEDDEDAGELLQQAEAGGAAKKVRTEAGAKPAGNKTKAAEAERRTLAASLLTATQRKVYNVAASKQAKEEERVATLVAKRKEAEKKGEAGLGKAAAAAAAAGGSAAASGGGKKRQRS
jgi:pescadillo protein